MNQLPKNQKRAVPTSPPRRALVVAGMHRSGTSALARVLNLLGADLPRTLMAPTNDFRGNPRGFWESLPIMQLCDEILDSTGRSWHDFSPIPRSWFASKKAYYFEGRLAGLLNEEFGDSELFVVKDPRICRLVPMWRGALGRIGAEPSFLIPVRHPLEVADSLRARNRFSATKSLLLWLRHVLDAEWNSRADRRTVLAFEDLLSDWRSVTDRLLRELALDLPAPSEEAASEIDQFLSKGDRHHVSTIDELDARPDVSNWVKRAYDATAELIEGRDVEAEEMLDRVRRELDEADKTYGALLAEQDARVRTLESSGSARRHRQQQEELTELRRAARSARADTQLTAKLKREVGSLTLALTLSEAKAKEREAELIERRTEAARLFQLARHEAKMRLKHAAEVAKLRETLAALASAQAEVTRLNEELVVLTSRLGSAGQRLGQQREEIARFGRELSQKEEVVKNLQANLVESRALLEQAVAEKDAEVAALTSTVSQLEEETKRLQAELPEKERALASASRALEKKERALATASSDLERLRAELRATKGRRRAPTPRAHASKPRQPRSSFSRRRGWRISSRADGSTLRAQGRSLRRRPGSFTAESGCCGPT